MLLLEWLMKMGFTAVSHLAIDFQGVARKSDVNGGLWPRLSADTWTPKTASSTEWLFDGQCLSVGLGSTVRYR